jgi:hypothetical protein
MKTVILLMIFILLPIGVYASCDDIYADPLFNDNSNTCDNLHGIKVYDSNCKMFDCFEGFDVIETSFSEGIYSDKGDKWNIDHQVSYIVIGGIYCSNEGEKKVTILLDNSCSKEVIIGSEIDVVIKNEESVNFGSGSNGGSKIKFENQIDDVPKISSGNNVPAIEDNAKEVKIIIQNPVHNQVIFETAEQKEELVEESKTLIIVLIIMIIILIILLLVYIILLKI